TKLRVDRRPSVTGVARNAVARDGRDVPVGRNTPDPAVAGVVDQEPAVGKRGDAERARELRIDRGSTVAREAARPDPGNRPDRTVERDEPDPVVAGVGDQDPPVRE